MDVPAGTGVKRRVSEDVEMAEGIGNFNPSCSFAGQLAPPTKRLVTDSNDSSDMDDPDHQERCRVDPWDHEFQVAGKKHVIFGLKSDTEKSSGERWFFGDVSDCGDDELDDLFVLPIPDTLKCVYCKLDTTGRYGSCRKCYSEWKVRFGGPPRMKKRPAPDPHATLGVPPEELCVVCMLERKCLVLVHGRTAHECVCYDCASRLVARPIPKRRCPVCRKIFTSVKANVNSVRPK